MFFLDLMIFLFFTFYFDLDARRAKSYISTSEKKTEWRTC